MSCDGSSILSGIIRDTLATISCWIFKTLFVFFLNFNPKSYSFPFAVDKSQAFSIHRLHVNLLFAAFRLLAARKIEEEISSINQTQCIFTLNTHLAVYPTGQMFKRPKGSDGPAVELLSTIGTTSCEYWGLCDRKTERKCLLLLTAGYDILRQLVLLLSLHLIARSKTKSTQMRHEKASFSSSYFGRTGKMVGIASLFKWSRFFCLFITSE